jgi:hypothetical protein
MIAFEDGRFRKSALPSRKNASANGVEVKMPPVYVLGTTTVECFAEKTTGMPSTSLRHERILYEIFSYFHSVSS